MEFTSEPLADVKVLRLINAFDSFGADPEEVKYGPHVNGSLAYDDVVAHELFVIKPHNATKRHLKDVKVRVPVVATQILDVEWIVLFGQVDHVLPDRNVDCFDEGFEIIRHDEHLVETVVEGCLVVQRIHVSNDVTGIPIKLNHMKESAKVINLLLNTKHLVPHVRFDEQMTLPAQLIRKPEARMFTAHFARVLQVKCLLRHVGIVHERR